MSADQKAGQVEVFGIRHHGPGSARAVAAALEEFQPDAVLIEGPSDAEPILPLAGAGGMVPPVALLAYAVDDPARSVFWPFAVFSPEWQALTWALAHDVPVRFCDLPASVVLARGTDGPRAQRSAERADPLAMLAEAAGYSDPERWWDDVIESQIEGLPGAGLFTAITEAMAELRLASAPEPVVERLREDQREAYMRTRIRAARAGGAERVAVICGAWHAPALVYKSALGEKSALVGKQPSATADARLLRGLPKRKTAITWVPWTHSRLSAASGYGAGVTSPGWYHHLFSQPELTVTRWLTAVARVLRTEDLPVSSANVIEAVRLAEALATLRGRRLAGLDEVTEATRAVLVDGDEVGLALVTARLVVGEALGEVPEGTPTVPLEADLRAQVRRLRLKFEAEPRTLDLDLRTPGGLARSRMLHRLSLLEIRWGVPAASAVQATGTFRETWRLAWQPELSVSVIEAAMWGSTVQAAALARLRDTAADKGSAGTNPGTKNTGTRITGAQNATVPQLTAAVEACLLADLPEALGDLLTALDQRAAVDVDLEHLTAALPALVRALRYGDVRGTDTGALGRVADAVLTRICVGLPTAVTGLDDTGAAALRTRLDEVHAAVALLDQAPPDQPVQDQARPDQPPPVQPPPVQPPPDQPLARSRWLLALSALIDRSDVHGLLIGRMVRILRDARVLEQPDAADRLARALSVGTTSRAKAAWVEGFFSGGGLLLVHDRGLLALLDGWIVTLGEQEFVDVLPLLRRTFGEFAPGERRGIGERVRRPDTGRPRVGIRLDEVRAARGMATVAELLGVAR